MSGTQHDFYLGQTAGAFPMTKVPPPNKDITTTPSRRDVRHDLLGGGVAVGHSRRTRREYAFGWDLLDDPTAGLIRALAYGHLGLGPYRLLDPADTNHLPGYLSSAGRVNTGSTTQAIPGFQPSAGTLASQGFALANGVPGGPVLSSDVITWTGAANSASVTLGSNSAGLMLASSVPAVVGLTACFSIFFRLNPANPSGAGAKLRCALGTAPLPAPSASAGNLMSGTVVTLTSAWQQAFVAVQIPQGAPSLLVPSFLAGSSGITNAPLIDFSAPMLEYGVASPSNWLPGVGVPSVVVDGDLGAISNGINQGTYALTLTEV